MADYLLDTVTASQIMRAERPTVAAMRRSGAQSTSISAVTYSELLYGAHLSGDHGRTAKVRRFIERVVVQPWDHVAAETHAVLRARSIRRGRGAGPFDIMIAAHALALGVTLVTSDKAIANLRIDGLRIVEW